METLKAAGPSPSGGRREKEQRLKAELVGRMAAFEAARAGEAGEALTLRVAETLERLGCPSLWLDRKGR